MFSQIIYLVQVHRDELFQAAEKQRLIKAAQARRPRRVKYLAANLGHFLNLLGPWLKTQYRSLFIKFEIKEKVQ